MRFSVDVPDTQTAEKTSVGMLSSSETTDMEGDVGSLLAKDEVKQDEKNTWAATSKETQDILGSIPLSNEQKKKSDATQNFLLDVVQRREGWLGKWRDALESGTRNAAAFVAASFRNYFSNYERTERRHSARYIPTNEIDGLPASNQISPEREVISKGELSSLMCAVSSPPAAKKKAAPSPLAEKSLLTDREKEAIIGLMGLTGLPDSLSEQRKGEIAQRLGIAKDRSAQVFGVLDNLSEHRKGEIAQRLGITADRFSQLINNARRKLRESARSPSDQIFAVLKGAVIYRDYQKRFQALRQNYSHLYYHFCQPASAKDFPLGTHLLERALGGSTLYELATVLRQIERELKGFNFRWVLLDFEDELQRLKALADDTYLTGELGFSVVLSRFIALNWQELEKELGNLAPILNQNHSISLKVLYARWLKTLSVQEKLMLDYIDRGFSLKEIADKLGLDRKESKALMNEMWKKALLIGTQEDEPEDDGPGRGTKGPVQETSSLEEENSHREIAHNSELESESDLLVLDLLSRPAFREWLDDEIKEGADARVKELCPFIPEGYGLDTSGVLLSSQDDDEARMALLRGVFSEINDIEGLSLIDRLPDKLPETDNFFIRFKTNIYKLLEVVFPPHRLRMLRFAATMILFAGATYAAVRDILPQCSDRKTQEWLGEECDDGNDINTDACTKECKNASCGDGFVQGNEQCDDGNDINTDACTKECKNASCGDGFVQGNEKCDDGNDINTDACTKECKNASCGDGFVQGNEQCEDINTISGDGCDNVCIKEFCGDGIANNGTSEECDDGVGNNSNQQPDACRTNCRLAGCGDGVVDFKDSCDDGNHIQGDSCENDCKLPICGNNIIDYVKTVDINDDGEPDLVEQCDGKINNSVNNCDDRCQIIKSPKKTGGDKVDY